ncbi:MAG: AroM family protein [Acetobacteraceae bacterium]|nr:AroM family protein [Acetobacteraceae bacterium]
MPIFVIGQTPRVDLETEIRAAAPELHFSVHGALDGLARTEIDRLPPRDDSDALFTILPSGEKVIISKIAVAKRLVGILPDGPALLACTGTFKGLPSHRGLIQPSAVLNALAAALLPAGRLGLFVPLAEQVATLTAARSRPQVEVHAVPLQPGSDDAARDAAAVVMADFAPDLVLLDCISYSRADKARIGKRVACPILLSIAVAVRVATSMMSEG